MSFPSPSRRVQGANIGVSVVFKEFGIRLTFTPTVIGDRVHLKVRPEVSTLDFANAVTLSGFRVRADDTSDRDRARAAERPDIRDRRPHEQLGDVNPFQGTGHWGHCDSGAPLQEQGCAEAADRAHRDAITPQILPNNSSGVTRDLPRMQEPFLPALPQQKLLPEPPPAFSGPRPSVSAQPAAAPVAARRSKRADPSAASAADRRLRRSRRRRRHVWPSRLRQRQARLPYRPAPIVKRSPKDQTIGRRSSGLVARNSKRPRIGQGGGSGFPARPERPRAGASPSRADPGPEKS